MRLFVSRVLSPLILLAVACLPIGCGSQPDFTPPKTELTEEEKQQIKELNEQRQSEWGPPATQPEGS